MSQHVAAMRQPIGVVIVDHGSKRPESNAMLEEVVDLFRRSSPFEIVEPAHMELAEPSIAQAFDRCVMRGARSVVIHPYFLFPGRHWHSDIPALAKEAAARHPRVAYLVTAPLGLDQRLADLMQSRIDHCLAHAAGTGPDCDVCRGVGCGILTAEHRENGGT